MSNIGNKLMAGFFATPVEVGALLKEVFNFSAPAAVIDPTCGKGDILDQLCGDKKHIRTYGVEVEKSRALIAEKKLDVLVNAPIESMRISRNSFSFVYLNPPYDNEIRQHWEDTKRKEDIELERSLKYLMPGGVLCFVVSPRSIVSNAKTLATEFSEIQIARFDDGFFEDYHQCIFIGRKKIGIKSSFSEEAFNIFNNFSDDEFILKNVRPLSELVGKKVYDIRASEPNVKTFVSRIESKTKHISLIKNNASFQIIHDKLAPRIVVLDSQPIINVSQGQMGLLLASGAVNGLLAENINGDNQHLVQGLEIVGKSITREVLEDGEIKTIERTKREVSVKIITPHEIKKLT